MSFIESWRTPPSLQNLEQRPIPSGVPIGTWKFYARAIPDGKHLAFVFLRDPRQSGTGDSPVKVINLVFGILGLMILSLLIFDKCPVSLSLNARFSLLFLALAAIPFSLLIVSTKLYLSELKVSLLREARQKLHKALSSFDQNVDDVYRVYRNEMRKLHQEEWIQHAGEETDPVDVKLDAKFKEYIARLNPPLPWGSIAICDAKGKTVLTYRNKNLQNRLGGYMMINRVGVIEAMRKRRNMPSIEDEGKNELISDDDITMKQVYETQVKLPIYHAFSNTNVGEILQIAFGNMSVMRIVDYFPSENSPVFGVSVAWLEHELDREFSINALQKMKRENPGIQFEVFKTDDNDLIRIARTHKYSNLHNIAKSASLRDGFANSLTSRFGRIEIAFPSNRRPGIFLAGAMDTTYIDTLINYYFRRFMALLFLGFLGMLYFRDILFKRIIIPFLLLEETLASIQDGFLPRLPAVLRHDELRKIYDSFNEMIEGLQIRNRLMSLVSSSALKVAREQKTSDESAEMQVPVVALVSDIRGFTTMCEKYNPEAITSLLNLHFDRMSSIIHAQGGEIGRFVGDAIEASFRCDDGNISQTMENAVKAALLMLENLNMINDERVRQGLFPYKIGVGLSFGKVSFFSVGGANSRTEVLQLGKPMKKAGELEALTKNYPECPLVIDREIGLEISKKTTFAEFLNGKVQEDTEFYYFKSFPAANKVFEISETANIGETGQNQHVVTDAHAARQMHKRAQDHFFSVKLNLSPGLVILALPFLIGLYAIFVGIDKDINSLRQNAHQANQHAINLSRFSNVKKEQLSINFQRFLGSRIDRSWKEFSAGDKNTLKEFESEAARELHSYGLKTIEIVALPFAEEYRTNRHSQNSLAEELETALADGLKCYNSKFNRYLLVDPQKLAVFEDSISELVFSRDARATFIPVSARGKDCWLYWQPLLKPYTEWKRACTQASSWQMRLYGYFPEPELPDLLAGGFLALCQSPENEDDLKLSHEDNSIFFARIDVKTDSLLEIHGTVSNPSTADLSDAQRILATAYSKDSEKSGLIVDTNLVAGSSPELQISMNSIKAGMDDLNHRGMFAAMVLLAGFIIAMACWFMFVSERGPAKMVMGQIMVCFFGTIMIPASAIFLIISLLQSDWKTNLLEQSKSDFLTKVDQIEQQISFHHTLNPISVWAAINEENLEKFADLDRVNRLDAASFANFQNELRTLLHGIYEKLFRMTRGIGMNSLIVCFSTGLQESLQVYGTLAEPGNPMLRTFSYMARNILQRVNPKVFEKAAPKLDMKQLTIDEMIANQVFDIIATTYGDDAAIDLMFGEGRPVSLFGGTSKDVVFQKFYPDSNNPAGVIFWAMSHFYSNQFALSRILTALHSGSFRENSMQFGIYAMSKFTSGMPMFPDCAEKLPFIREIGRQSSISGHIEKVVNFSGQEYHVITQHSKLIPQFIFIGVSKLSSYSDFISSKIWRLIQILFALFVLLAVLSLSTSRDITIPLKSLLAGIERVKKGDYSFFLTFVRDDKLERIAQAFSAMLERLEERNLLAKMVSESASKMASSEELEKIALKGRRRKAVVLYFGINQLEKLISESELSEMKQHLNQWVELICSEVIANGGEVDKIMEGKILATFFVDQNQSDGSSKTGVERTLCRACKAAVNACKKSRAQNLTTSCGIHLGDVISGLMGSQERRDHTIIGDPVNLAARCFTLSETNPNAVGVVITASTVVHLSDDFTEISLGSFSIKGKTETQELYLLNS